MPSLCKRVPAVLAAASLIFLSAAAQTAPGQTTPASAPINQILRSLSRGHAIGQVAIAPDGSHLAWIDFTRAGEEIRLAPITDLAASRRITAAAPGQHCREEAVTWSPDSAALAFLSDCAHPDAQPDLYLAPADGSPARRLTELNGYVQAPAFSPDGKSIAFLYVEGATRPAGALAAQDLPSGVIGEDKTNIQRVATVDANAPQPQNAAFATPPSLHVFEFDWAPDSHSLAYIAADPPGENNWWVARLYTQTLPSYDPTAPIAVAQLCPRGGCTPPHLVLNPQTVSGPLHGLQIAVPRWSPDGKSIAFIGGLMSDQGATGGDVWIVPAQAANPSGNPSASSRPIDLTPKRPTSPAWLTWADDRTLFVSELAGANSQLVRLHLAPGRASAAAVSTVFSIPAAVADGRMARSLSVTASHALFVFTASTFDRPPEIYSAAANSPADSQTGSANPPSTAAPGFAALTQLSHFNTGIEPAWGKSVSLAWTNGGFHVQGWLMLPKDYDPARKYPLIVEVHGGPASAVLARWGVGGSLSPAAFSALGYFVLQPNPRGSFGQGEAFTQANRKDFGYGDLRDILAGVDRVESRYPIDPNRVGVTGWSYGGYMTMFAVTQTRRFKAAVAGAGISDWLSYYGENSIDQWMIPYFGASVYDDPQVYRKSSPITYIKSTHTPTLIVVGDRDGECPAPQSYEFWHALRDMHVPAQFVVYPNEGHGFVDPAHRIDVLERAVAWFDRYMPAGH